jgi:alanine racemase
MRFKTELSVNFSVLESNFQKLSKIIKGNEIIFMVKANAYGHGLVSTTRFAHEEAGIREFGLASLGEAVKLRLELPNLKFEASVFSELQFDNTELRELYQSHRIIPVISDLIDLEIFLSDPNFKHFPLRLHFNTGMNRLGLEIGEVEKVSTLLKENGRKSIDHLMTHFACAANSMSSNSHNKRQIVNWEKLKSELRGCGISIDQTSLSNSGAIEQGVGFEESHVRPGLMLYGPSSLIPPIRSQSLWTGQNISTLKTEVLKVFKVDRGQPVGYGATPSPEAGEVAIIALGYGDGFQTSYQSAHIAGGRVLGRVNMDMAQIFYKENCPLKKGDRFVVWDENQESVMNLSDESGNTPYTLFCSLSERVARTYLRS